MAPEASTSSRDRELIIITVGSIIAIAVIVGFLLFIKTNADDSRPARTGETAEIVVE